MKTIKINCPVCGNDEFVLIDPPYHCGMDTYIQDNTKYYACTSCALVLRFARDIVDRIVEDDFLATENGKQWSELNRNLENMVNNVNVLKKKQTSLLEELTNDGRTIKRDKEIKEELLEITSRLDDLNREVEETTSKMEKLRK